MASADIAPQEGGYHFLRRLSDIPVVSSTVGYATETYGKVKEASPLIRYTLDTAEKSVQFASDQVKPVVQRFEKPIELVDGVACKGLDKIEQLAPAIKKTPSEIIDDTKQLCTAALVQKYEGLLSYGNEKVSAVKNYGYQKASDLLTSPYGQLLTSSVDGALTATEAYLDYYLPEKDSENTNDIKPAQNGGVPERVGHLSAKIQRRVSTNLATAIATLQTRSHDSLSKLNQTLLLIQYARDNFDATKQQLGVAASRLWEELIREQQEGEGQGSLESRILGLARSLTQQLAHTYQSAASLTTSLPRELQERLITARTYTHDLLAHFNQAQALSDLTSSIISQISQKLTFLEHVFIRQPSESVNPEIPTSDSPSPPPEIQAETQPKETIKRTEESNHLGDHSEEVPSKPEQDSLH